jgi:hypothetical protein
MRITAVLMAVSLIGGVARATVADIQPEVPEPVSVSWTPETYGVNGESTFSVSSHGFKPRSSSMGFDTFWNFGTMYQTSGSPDMFYAPFDLPAGARITAVTFNGYDTDAATDINWGILRMTPDGLGDLGIGWWYVPYSGGSFTQTAVLGVPVTVDHANFYAFIVEFNVVAQTQRLRGMRVHYTLQVSPAPGTATFGDVPTSHIFFQYVEALVASGITAGCGGGNYCPDSPLTRGQMAVFLSKALGLHWAP